MKFIKIIVISILFSITPGFSSMMAQKGLKEVFNNTIIVNSRSNFGGTSRKTVMLSIPSNAEGFYYTVHVYKRNTTRKSARIILLNVVADDLNNRDQIVTDTEHLILEQQEKYVDINIFLLSSKEDSDKFKKRLSYDYEYLYKWEDVGDEVRFVPYTGQLFMGFHNTNATVGLEVELQVVAKF